MNKTVVFTVTIKLSESNQVSLHISFTNFQKSLKAVLYAGDSSKGDII